MTETTTFVAPTTNETAIPDNDSRPGPAKGFAVTALVTGIVGVLLALTFILGQFGAVFGVVAVVFGFLATRKNKKNGHKRGLARAGLILGMIAVPLGMATSAIFVSAVDSAVTGFDQNMTVLEAEWHLESEYTDYTNDIDATATPGDVVNGVTEIVVTETGTTNVLATHQVQINDNGTFVILD